METKTTCGFGNGLIDELSYIPKLLSDACQGVSIEEYVCNLNTASLRDVLVGIEEDIKQTAGEHDEYGLFRKYNMEKLHKLHGLLKIRSFVLNEMMSHPTESEVKRLEYQNNRLQRLTDEMYMRLHDMEMMFEENKPLLEEEQEYYFFEGLMKYHYYNEDDVVRLDNDDFYGSDFSYMLNLASSVVTDDCFIHVDKNENYQDDGRNWAEGYLCNEAYKHIRICHAFYALCRNRFYSLPDVLRMNSFKACASLNYSRNHSTTKEQLT